MLKKIRKIYPQNEWFIYCGFDISILLYFIAYFYHYTDDAFSGNVRLFATGMVICFGTLLVVKNIYKLKFDICTTWYILFVVLGIISMMWAIDSSQISTMLVMLFRIIIVGLLISVRIRSEQDVEIILTLYVIGVVYMVINIAVKMIDFYSFESFYLRRFGDNFGYNSNMTAMQAVFALLICLHKSKKNKKINYILMIFFGITIMLTGSKKGIFGLLLGIVIYTFFKSKGVKKIRTLAISLLCVLLAYSLIMNVPYLYNQIGFRIESFLDVLLGGKENSTSTIERMALIKQGIDIWIEHFFIGVGLNNFSLAQSVRNTEYYAHCNYIEILADLGIVGLLLYYSIPMYLAVYKTKMNSNLFLIIKTIIVVILFFDIGAITYQRIQIVIFYWIGAAIVRVEKNIISNSRRVYVNGNVEK